MFGAFLFLCYHVGVTIIPAALFFALGTIIASFVGVVVGRLYSGESIVRGSSRCDVCGVRLSAFSLVPIVSYIASSARARCCNARLSWRAPASELLLGALFVLSYLHLGATLLLAFFLLALALLLALVLYDLAHQILPPLLLWPFVLAAAAAGYLAAPSMGDFWYSCLVAGAFALFFAALHFCSGGRAMGLADTPLVFGLALLVGPAAFSGLLFSFWVGAAVGITILFMTPLGSRMGIEVPFAPFLAAGFLLAYFTQWNILTLLAFP